MGAEGTGTGDMGRMDALNRAEGLGSMSGCEHGSSQAECDGVC